MKRYFKHGFALMAMVLLLVMCAGCDDESTGSDAMGWRMQIKGLWSASDDTRTHYLLISGDESDIGSVVLYWVRHAEPFLYAGQRGTYSLMPDGTASVHVSGYRGEGADWQDVAYTVTGTLSFDGATLSMDLGAPANYTQTFTTQAIKGDWRASLVGSWHSTEIYTTSLVESTVVTLDGSGETGRYVEIFYYDEFTPLHWRGDYETSDFGEITVEFEEIYDYKTEEWGEWSTTGFREFLPFSNETFRMETESSSVYILQKD